METMTTTTESTTEHRIEVLNTTTTATTFRVTGGRRLANDTNVAYILPSDQDEVERLKLNHNLWKYVNFVSLIIYIYSFKKTVTY